MPWRRGEPGTHPIYGSNESGEDLYVRHHTKLARHAAIRRIVSGRFGTDGVSSLAELKVLLSEIYNINTHIMSLSKDLREMGALKVKDAERPSVEWWVIPAWNPNRENLREALDPSVVESEVTYKVALHVIDITPLGNQVFVMTEPRAGPLIAYWLSWLTWHGMVYVQEQLDGCIINCFDENYAFEISRRLLTKGGDPDDEEAEAEGQEEPAGGDDGPDA